MSRSYVADLPGGTATTTIQAQAKQRFRWASFNVTCAAAGKVELSRSSASQIGTAQPTSDVICRLNVPAAGGPLAMVMGIDLSVVPFQSIYVHQTGAGNLGQINLY
jgi:hypothetical protein